MDLGGYADQSAPSATAEGSKPVPSEKAMRKRPMTTEQILREYANAPTARSGYDSDDEHLVHRGTPLYVRHERAAALANLHNIPPVPLKDGVAAEYTFSFRGADLRSPATVEREWMDELDRALALQAEEDAEYDEEMVHESELFSDCNVVSINILDAPTGIRCTSVHDESK